MQTTLPYKFVLTAQLGTQSISSVVKPVFSEAAIIEDLKDYHNVVSFKGDLTFINNPAENIYDFNLISQCEQYGINTRINIDVYVENALKYQGYFYPYQGEWDYDRCTVSAALITSDEFTCLTKYWATKENVLTETSAWGEYRITPTVFLKTYTCTEKLYVDFNPVNGGCRAISEGAGGLPLTFSNYNGQVFVPSYLDPAAFSQFAVVASNCLINELPCWYCPTTYGYRPIDAARVIESTYKFLSPAAPYNTTDNNGNVVVHYVGYYEVTTVWGFEVTITENDPVTLAQNMPAGGGWFDNLQYYLNGILVTEWFRIPYYNNQVYNYRFVSRNCNGDYVFKLINPYWNDVNSTVKIYRGRNLYDVVNMFLAKSGCGLTYKSEFFNSDINPVTGEANKLNKLQINRCDDIKDPDSSEPATILLMTFKDLLNELHDKFNVNWSIKDGYFILEHVSYYENGYSYLSNTQAQIDLTGRVSKQTGTTELVKTNRYRYNVDKIYNKEKWSCVNYFYYDFSELTIDYGVQGENDEIVYESSFVTDVQAIYSFPDTFSNESVVLIAIEEVVVDPLTGQTIWIIVNETGERTQQMVINGHLCVSNLVDKYWRHGRVFINGNLFGENQQFYSAINKKLQSVIISDCADELTVADIVKTNLGTGTVIRTAWNIATRTKEMEIEL